MVDFNKIKTFSVKNRRDLVRIDNMLVPGEYKSEVDDSDFAKLVSNIIRARKNGRPVIFSMGAHVIKNNLSLFVIELINMGVITHIASNGAGSIHDFEIAYHGGTSEDVPTAIEDGSFGMWEETGRWMNEAIIAGCNKGLGYGESLAVYMDENPDRFPHIDMSIAYTAWKKGISATYHIAIGTDIIHQHPICDFGAIGSTSGADFKKMCDAVAGLDGGVYLNFGSAVIGPEVFLKALSISRHSSFYHIV